MAEGQGGSPGGIRTEPGHLSVKLEGLRPEELVFSFERQPERMSKALLGSIAAHGTLVLVAVLMTLYGPKAYQQTFAPEPTSQMVFLATPGPGGGGGGGGNQSKEPPPKVELPGKEKITIPAVKPTEVTPQVEKKVEPPPEQDLTIPVASVADSDQPVAGVLESTVTDASISRGSGTGTGAGTGRGSGIGEGRGSGLGEGDVAGMGGGVYRPGSGIELPRVIREVKPQYTAEAMRAKVQGIVLVEAVVQQDGTVGNVHVVRSLDQTFGLDQEAVKAARQWRFVPGTRFGRPVPVLVTIELAFTLR